MIIEIKKSFGHTTLGKKIEYQLKKVEKQRARELYCSAGDDLSDLYNTMMLASSMNDRIKKPFIEFIISLPNNENLTDEQFTELAKEYLEKMGYQNSCYSIIINEDTDNSHVHILATTIDTDTGKKIKDNFDFIRSNEITRELEIKYGLTEMQKKGFSKTSLGESQYRKYFFDKALRKALKNYVTKQEVSQLLNRSEVLIKLNYNSEKTLTNAEWEIVLGTELYEQIGKILTDNNFFNPLFKDELLTAMDKLYMTVKDAAEFRDKLQQAGYYMRLVSDRDKSYYVYGIPEQSFYVKDKSLPQKYRYGHIKFNVQRMSADEQKHYLYGHIFMSLNKSGNYDDFKSRLFDNQIQMMEHYNRNGIYGLSFTIIGIENPSSFKASDISRRLSYAKIQDFFNNKSEEIEKVTTSIESEQWRKEVNYMFSVSALMSGVGEHKSRKEDDEEDIIKKKKKRKQQRLM